MNNIDLTGVRSIDITTGWQQAPSAPIEFEVRLDARAGRLLGKGRVAVPKKGQTSGTATVRISPVNDGKFHKIYFIYTPPKARAEMQAGVTDVRFNAD